jgi:hypothetical protein
MVEIGAGAIPVKRSCKTGMHCLPFLKIKSDEQETRYKNHQYNTYRTSYI